MIFAAILFSWVLLNAFLLAGRGNTFDPYPYILLNLFLAMLTAAQAPVILMSQNRHGALQRYLAEAAWLPTSLLPNENLKWTAIDDRKALPTLSDSGTTVSLEFSFNETGEITGDFAPERFYKVKGEYKSFPRAGRFWNYQEKNRMMIPMECEVKWQMPDRNSPYWKEKIVETRYDFAQWIAP